MLEQILPLRSLEREKARSGWTRIASSSIMKKTTAEQEVSLFFHVICFITNFLAVKHALNPKFAWFTFQRYGGQLKYMSHWLLYGNTIYSLYALLVDIYNIFKGYTCKPKEEDDRPVLVRIRDQVFNKACFPFGVGHTLVFLCTTLVNNGFFVSLINRRKEELKSYYMLYLHVFPLIFCILEVAMVYHKPSKNPKKGMQVPVGLATLYLGWILWVAYFGAYWSYPFLRRASVAVRVLCLALLLVVAAASYCLGTKATHWFWGSVSNSETVCDTKDKKD